MTRPRLLQPGFKYVCANDTDIRKTFSRIRRQLKEAEAAKKPAANVKPLKKEIRRG